MAMAPRSARALLGRRRALLPPRCALDGSGSRAASQQRQQPQPQQQQGRAQEAAVRVEARGEGVVVFAQVLMRHGDRAPTFNALGGTADAAAEAAAWVARLPGVEAEARLERLFSLARGAVGGGAAASCVEDKDTAFGKLTSLGAAQLYSQVSSGSLIQPSFNPHQLSSTRRAAASGQSTLTSSSHSVEPPLPPPPPPLPLRYWSCQRTTAAHSSARAARWLGCWAPPPLPRSASPRGVGGPLLP